MWDLLDFIQSLFIAKDATDMARKVKDDKPKERKCGWVAVVLLFALAIAGVFFVLLDVEFFQKFL